MELDTNSDYPDVHDDVDAMETDDDFDKEMNFVDDGEFSLHGDKKEDDDGDRPNVDGASTPSEQQPTDVGGVRCDDERSVEFTDSNDSASRKKVSRDRPYSPFGERFVVLVATMMGDARGGHEDGSFVLSDDGENDAKEPFANGDHDPRMTRRPSENDDAAATRSYDADSESAGDHDDDDNDSMFSQENENWAAHAAVHDDVENMRSSMRSSRSLTRSPIITTTATTRNDDDDRRDAKEATTIIDDVANQVAKRNQFDDDHDDELRVANKVAKRNDDDEENDDGPRATREVTMIRWETLVVVPVADGDDGRRRSTRRGTICRRQSVCGECAVT